MKAGELLSRDRRAMGEITDGEWVGCRQHRPLDSVSKGIDEFIVDAAYSVKGAIGSCTVQH